ncbi:MAG: SseB family protein [Elusimicrobia bacterium]|nr:SseB family protein [Elusimicrobiota bacterium]
MKLLDIVGLPWSAAKRLLGHGLKTLARGRFPANGALRAAFEAFSTDRSPANRRAFYEALLSSKLIVAAKRPAGGRGVEFVELAVGSEGGIIAFAHPDGLDQAVPEWSQAAAVEGRVLFRMALKKKRDFVLLDLFGTRLVFKGPDIGRLAAGGAPASDPAPAKLSGPGQTKWSRRDPAPSSRLLSVLGEEAARLGVSGCYLLGARLDDGAERAALVFKVHDEAGLASIRRYMESVDLRLKPEDWGGPVHVVAMTGPEIEPLRPLAVVVRS